MQILKDEIKRRILERSSETFINRGYEKTTMSNIAKLANVSVGNIYRYFESKEKILENLILEFENDLETFSITIEKNTFSDSSQKQCDKFIADITKLFKRNYKAMIVLSQNISSERFNKFRYQISSNIAEKIMFVSKSLNNNKIDKVVANATALSAIAGIEYIIKQNAKENELNKKVDDEIKAYLRLILRDLIFRIKEV